MINSRLILALRYFCTLLIPLISMLSGQAQVTYPLLQDRYTPTEDDQVRYVCLQQPRQVLNSEISSPVLYRPQSFDVLHYDVHLNLDSMPKPLTLKSWCNVKFVWVATPDTFRFHLRGLRVDSVRYVSGQGSGTTLTDAAFTQIGTPASSMFHYAVSALGTHKAGDTVILNVVYSGTMTSEPLVNGFSWGGVHQDQSDAVYALGVGFYCNYVSTTQHWMPCYDHPSDKATFSGSFVCSQDNVVVSNGRKTAQTLVAPNKMQFDWQMAEPCATYLLTFACGPYAELNFESTIQRFPLVVYAKPVDSTNVRFSFSKLPDMVTLYERLFSPYPFEKVGYVVSELGSMEHQSLINLARPINNSRNPNSTTIAHELAHQWFGDLVTAYDFRDAWLSESFATYCESLWKESIGGKSAYHDEQQAKIDGYIYNISRQGGSLYEGVLPIYDFPRAIPSSNYPTTIYYKGAAVLGMLRYLLGDSVFFRSLRHLLESRKFKNASYDSVVQSFVLSSPPQLQDSVTLFFSQWVKGKGYASLEANIAKERTKDGWRAVVNLSQVQPDSIGIYTWLPVELSFQTASGSSISRVVILNGKSAIFTFDSLQDYVYFNVNTGSAVRSLVVLNKQATITEVEGAQNVLCKRARIYPTPASDIVWIKSDAPEVELSISNTIGQIVEQERRVQLLNGVASIDTSGLPLGVYIITIRTATAKEIVPLVIER